MTSMLQSKVALDLILRTSCEGRNGKAASRNEENDRWYVRGANQEPGWSVRVWRRPVVRHLKPAISAIRRTPASRCSRVRYATGFIEARPNAPKGMSLAKKAGAQTSMMKAFEEEGIVDTEDSPEEAVQASSSLPTEGIVIQMVEHVSIQTTNEGAVESIECKGELTLTVYDEALANCRIAVDFSMGGKKLQTRVCAVC